MPDCLISRSIRFVSILLALIAFTLPVRSAHCEARSAGCGVRSALAAGRPGDSSSPIAPASVSGTVTDPDGRPVPNAEVLLVRASAVEARTRTDGNGRFDLKGVREGQYEIHVAVEGFRAEPRRVTIAGNGDAHQVDLPLAVSAVSESVVVSASQVDVPLSRVADSATVMTSRDIAARQLETVGEALRLVPGVSVAMNGGRGSVTSIFARGGESDYALVLVNGVRANAFGGGFDFSQLPSTNIERIEVVRGAGSALFGSDAIGAVVSITTRQGGKPNAHVALETGSLDTRRLTASASGARGNWSWGGGLERVTSDGFTGMAPATGERVSNDDYRSHQATATTSWRGTNGAEVAFNGLWNRSERGFPGPFGSNPIGAYTTVDRLSRGLVDTRQVGASLNAPVGGGRVRQHAQLSWFDLSSDFQSAFGLSASGTRRLAARSQTDVAIGASSGLSVGLDVQHERAQSDFITGETSTPVPISRNLVGLFGEARHQHGSRLTVAAGVRLEQVRRDALDGSPNPFSPRPPFSADTVRSVNPKASLSYLLYASDERRAGLSWVRLRGSGGTGMRAPDALEIAFTDNPHLKPERSRSVEGGVELGMAGGRLGIEASYFANRYDDLIVAVGPALRDASRFQTDNIANARARGMELAVRVRTAWGLEARGAYTRLDTAVLAVDRSGVAPSPFEVGDALLRRPRHQGSLDLLFARGRLTAYSQVVARGATLDIEPTFGAFGGLFRNPGFAAVRCGASWRLVRPLELVGRIDNLFDRRYEETFGFPSLGRTVMVGVRVVAGR